MILLRSLPRLSPSPHHFSCKSMNLKQRKELENIIFCFRLVPFSRHQESFLFFVRELLHTVAGRRIGILCNQRHQIHNTIMTQMSRTLEPPICSKYLNLTKSGFLNSLRVLSPLLLFLQRISYISFRVINLDAYQERNRFRTEKS